MRTAALCPARRSGYNPAGATDPFLAPQDRPIPPTRILVIKLSALGNVVLSLGPFAAIRRHHPDAEITLLTTRPYAAFLAGSPYFDRIWSDGRPPWWDLLALARLRRRLIGAGFARVYDLQTSGRSSRYFHLFPRAHRPDWSGIARGCSHPDRSPDRARLHDFDRQVAQLRQAGIPSVPPAELGWSQADLAPFALPADFALLAPGSSPHRPDKRWPVSAYGRLAAALAARGIAPVVLGTAGERGLAAAIRQVAPEAIDLTGRTKIADLASLARAARLAVGNDTGPMHLLAAAGCPSLVLFSAASDPALAAPRGPRVAILRRDALADLPLEAVLAAAEALAVAPGVLPLAFAALRSEREGSAGH